MSGSHGAVWCCKRMLGPYAICDLKRCMSNYTVIVNGCAGQPHVCGTHMSPAALTLAVLFLMLCITGLVVLLTTNRCGQLRTWLIWGSTPTFVSPFTHTDEDTDADTCSIGGVSSISTHFYSCSAGPPVTHATLVIMCSRKRISERIEVCIIWQKLIQTCFRTNAAISVCLPSEWCRDEGCALF
jgi:hypothetical protein